MTTERDHVALDVAAYRAVADAELSDTQVRLLLHMLGIPISAVRDLADKAAQNGVTLQTQLRHKLIHPYSLRRRREPETPPDDPQ